LTGDPLVPALEALLDRIPCAAVVIGPHALGKWQEHEYHAMVQRVIDHRSERGRRPRIVPVLIPGAAEVPTFLRNLAHADFRDAGLDDRREMRRLVDAILSARTRDGRGARGR
jgi:hypothetical protein